MQKDDFWRERRLPAPYYQEDGITIYHGDCRDILPHLEPVDLVLTDPPYGANWDTNYSRFSKGTTDKPQIINDERPVDLSPLFSISKEQIIFGANYLAISRPGSYFVWDKRCKDGFSFLSDGEAAWCSRGSGVYIFTLNGQKHRSTSGGLHPTQKPVPLMRWCIEKAANTQDIILDPFMGSGTTLVAAKELGRKAIGIEIEEKYCEIAVRRLAQGVFKFK